MLLRRMMRAQPSGTEFIMKPGYTTNGLHFNKFVKTEDDVKRYLERVTADIFGPTPTCYEIPYVMLQVRVMDRSEVKIVFLNRQFSHICSSSSSLIKKNLPGFSQIQLVAFATEALNLLPVDEYVLDGLTRVDIFKSNDGTLVVNEFESLEAGYFTTNGPALHSLQCFLQSYWEGKIYDCFTDVADM